MPYKLTNHGDKEWTLSWKYGDEDVRCELRLEPGAPGRVTDPRFTPDECIVDGTLAELNIACEAM